MKDYSMKRYVWCALLIAAPLLAAADDEVGHWYFDPQIGGIGTDGIRHTNDGYLYGLGIGNNLSEQWSAEVNLNGTQRLTDSRDSGHLNLYGGSLDFLRVFNRAASVAPYISLGVGAVRDSASATSTASSSTNFMAQAGVGWFLKLWENADDSRTFTLRPDFKVRWDDTSGANTHPMDFLATVGFQFSFGPGRTPVAVAAAPPPPPPPPAPVVQAPPPPPPPAPPAPVSKCPGTPAGIAVDQDGCPIKGSITLEGVNFETNQAVLTAESKPVLDQVAAGLSKYPRLRIEVQGHTDGVGSEPYNLTLSQHRAETVRDYLVAHGVAAAELTAVGYGKTRPIADNRTAQGRARNRRVVMVVLENPGDITVEGGGDPK
jgi:OmpA-OmpF porin, OOP family